MKKCLLPLLSPSEVSEGQLSFQKMTKKKAVSINKKNNIQERSDARGLGRTLPNAPPGLSRKGLGVKGKAHAVRSDARGLGRTLPNAPPGLSRKGLGGKRYVSAKHLALSAYQYSPSRLHLVPSAREPRHPPTRHARDAPRPSVRSFRLEQSRKVQRTD